MFRLSGDTESGRRERKRKEEKAGRRERRIHTHTHTHTHLPHSFATMQLFADHAQSNVVTPK